MDRLLAEYLAAMRTMPLAKAQELAACGIPWSAITAATPVPMRITINRAGDRYRPDAAGRPGWVLPVTAIDPAHLELIETNDPFWAIRTGPIIDLAAAYSPAAPGPWALRRGRATVLGAIPPQYLEPDPVRVHRDVAEWLRAGCSGIVLLTRDRNKPQRVLRQIHRVDTADDKPVAPPPSCAKPAWHRARLEGVVRKIITADQLQREGTLRWACRVLGAAAGNGEIRPDVAAAALVWAGTRAGLGEGAAQQLVAAAFGQSGGTNEGERRAPWI
jgi:hypothetical protein